LGVFPTAVNEIRDILHQTRCLLIDFFDLDMERVESILGTKGIRVATRLHGMGDAKRYNARMAAVEYAIEHHDEQSLRALYEAEVILVAPSQCGKTPTTMCLALQHGVYVANRERRRVRITKMSCCGS
jgi:[pyruvate, water dikinase]-phosphate phosphotransferase / [pyruvate, water dikinase] kinase